MWLFFWFWGVLFWVCRLVFCHWFGFLFWFYLLITTFPIIRLWIQLPADRATPGKMLSSEEIKKKQKIFLPFSDRAEAPAARRLQLEFCTSGNCSASRGRRGSRLCVAQFWPGKSWIFSKPGSSQLQRAMKMGAKAQRQIRCVILSLAACYPQLTNRQRTFPLTLGLLCFLGLLN